MQVWLDDEYEMRKRDFEGWTHCRWPDEVIALLKTGKVTDLSLDHDLGEGREFVSPRTGYDVVLWIEKEVVENPAFIPPRITVHSRNPSAREKMVLGIRTIIRLSEGRKTDED